MSRQWWNDTDKRLNDMHRLFSDAAKMIGDDLRADLMVQVNGIEEEIERRKRARALPSIRRGKTVEVIELLPDCAACATPPVGMVGKSLGRQYDGATAVEFSRAALYPREDGDYDDDDPHCVLFMPNYSIKSR